MRELPGSRRMRLLGGLPPALAIGAALLATATCIAWSLSVRQQSLDLTSGLVRKRILFCGLPVVCKYEKTRVSRLLDRPLRSPASPDRDWRVTSELSPLEWRSDCFRHGSTANLLTEASLVAEATGASDAELKSISQILLDLISRERDQAAAEAFEKWGRERDPHFHR
jgi:hypothetical protein